MSSSNNLPLYESHVPDLDASINDAEPIDTPDTPESTEPTDPRDSREPPSKKRRQKGLAYNLVESLSSFDLASNYLKSLDRPNPWYLINQNNGNHYYKCGKPSCPIRAYISVNQGDLSAQIFKTNDEHSHKTLITKRGISSDTKTAIEELYDSGLIKPAAILVQLAKQSLTVERGKLVNYLAQLKKKISENPPYP